jgi:hypothetical protein
METTGEGNTDVSSRWEVTTQFTNYDVTHALILQCCVKRHRKDIQGFHRCGARVTRPLLRACIEFELGHD